MDLFIYRHSYADTETMGKLALPARELQTIERPWIHDALAGSKPFESCVPDGIYDLVPHSSAKFGETWALVNPALKVYHYEEDIPLGQHGRTTCLLHAANWVHQLLGCIAPGLARTIMKDQLSVTGSKDAMDLIRKTLGVGSRGHRLIIQPAMGARVSLDG